MIWNLISTAFSVIGAIRSANEMLGSSDKATAEAANPAPVTVPLRQQLAWRLKEAGVPQGAATSGQLDGLLGSLLQAAGEEGAGLPLQARLNRLANRLAHDEQSPGLQGLRAQVQQLREAQGEAGMPPLNLGRLVSALASGLTQGGDATLGVASQV
ncbi:hypothetical protein [Pseudaeromonas paramecii]|uniref:Uncharacterized protein n=1 Tax=Pseudaeromonas paramecii TaxID=2138166 RepID=A0ABP8QD44_9GAMM